MMRITSSILILFLFITIFTSCKVSSGGKKIKTPETRIEKLEYYRGQLFTFETDINFHLKHQMDLNLKTDYERMEETLLSLSALLEKADQDIIDQMIKDMHISLDTFQKTKSYSYFYRENDKLFTKLRKLKKSIKAQEKNNVKEKEPEKKEETEKVK